ADGVGIQLDAAAAVVVDDVVGDQVVATGGRVGARADVDGGVRPAAQAVVVDHVVGDDIVAAIQIDHIGVVVMPRVAADHVAVGEGVDGIDGVDAREVVGVVSGRLAGAMNGSVVLLVIVGNRIGCTIRRT